MALDAVDEPGRRSGEALVREVTAVAAQATILRRVLLGWVRGRGLPPELAADLELAAYEAMANVVDHAYPDGTHGTMTVTARHDPGAIVVCVADTGRWRDGLSDPLRGRGLPLIRALAPEVTVTSTSTGTTVTMTWPWKAA
ncbi:MULTISPECIES: ATP-binding protein [Amycolatopsis]|uniref:ATP-binding protein n=1 Tax=Amycolatopsis thermalba TaxID=944492 RepID=A0ABY4NYZ3_9PSEU|nr:MULTISPECIES: ATP-binding protein [Amycolatopsis]OXM75088.1 anti-sigma 24 factor [Amycolatopsis sp. KNN50.9b]UQS25312.1 ATP-binding protein [Amycolatopsis thermalba]